MKLLKINILSLLITLFFIASCSERKTHKTYQDKNFKHWEDYVRNISNDTSSNLSLRNTLLLVLKSSECKPAISELLWWNNIYQKGTDFSIRLIILEKYSSTVEVFLSGEKITIPYYIDSKNVLFDKELLPITPMKLFINKKGAITNLASIGSVSDEKIFMKKIISKI